MNKEIKEKWIKALRSGEYKQGRGRMDREEGGEHYFCCLGVLCDISNLDRKPIPNEPHLFMYTYNGIAEDFNNCVGNYPPKLFSDSIRIDEDAMKVLANMNDHVEPYEVDFSEIADYIQENL